MFVMKESVMTPDGPGAVSKFGTSVGGMPLVRVHLDSGEHEWYAEADVRASED